MIRRIGEELGMNPTEGKAVWHNEHFKFSTDVGSGTWEVAFEPVRSVKEASEQIGLMHSITEIAGREGVLLLGLGVQPVSMPSWEQLMPMERYKAFADRYSTNNVLERPLVDLLRYRLASYLRIEAVRCSVYPGNASRPHAPFSNVAVQSVEVRCQP
ncbi:MAG: hypothetical protein KGH50_00560, partial [Candidatus Micrarchaeota archaeon]|nr:hypothetical protein [Candidatus Micrarchaeota archaeon]